MQDRRRDDDVAGIDGGFDEMIHDDAIGVHRHVRAVFLRTGAERQYHDWRLFESSFRCGPAQVPEVNPGRLAPGGDSDQ